MKIHTLITQKELSSDQLFCGPGQVTTWDQFEEEVRLQGHPLLAKLDDFPNSILVTGCQRSGTTILSRIIMDSEQMTHYKSGFDDELDGALILSGFAVPVRVFGRFCFQTTYLNANYHEYFAHPNGHKIIWLLRNPFAVISSMLRNWQPATLGRLFDSCGSVFLSDAEKKQYKRFGLWMVARLRQACLSYKGTILQLFELHARFDQDRLLIVSYEDLVHKKGILPEIYDFIDLEYKEKYSYRLQTQSFYRHKFLPHRAAATIEKVCIPVYNEALKLITK
jgi:hypothetical protein